MKASPIQFRREFVLVGGITLLALLPLFFLWRKSVISQQLPAFEGGTSTLVPVVRRMQLGKNSSISMRAALSPDGRWLARMEVDASKLNVEPSPGSSPDANELVIRSTANGKEVFRALGAGEFVGWMPSSVSFVSQSENIVNVFDPAVRKPGAPPPTQAWTQRTVPLPANTDPRFGASGETNDFDLQTGAIVFSPDFRFVVKGFWGQGPITWYVVDLMTGKAFPPVRAGRWINFDPKVGGYSNNISIAVAGANAAMGPLPLVAVLQTLEPSPESATPTPRPAPTLTPQPTPTYSAVQSQFKAKEDKEQAAIQALVESVLGVDGAEPKVTDETEVARITAEVKQRNKALDAERARVFPQTVMTPTPPPTVSPWSMTAPFQVETFDLNTKKHLWTSPLRSEVFPPQMKFSPDGSALVIWGTTAWRLQNGDRRVDGVGVEFHGARTGKMAGKSALYEGDFGIPDQNSVGFYSDTSAIVNGTPRSVAVLVDSYQGIKMPNGKFEPYQQGTVFRFFNAVNGHETGYLKADMTKLTANMEGFSTLSISQGGLFWMWGDSDIYIAKRQDLGQEHNGPLPSLTPDASIVRSTHVFGR